MSTPERIAFDARYVNGRYHGIGRFAFRLLEAMAQAAPEHTFLVYRSREQDSRFDWQSLADLANVELLAGPGPLYGPQEQLQWPWILRRDRADLFFSPFFAAPLLASCPVVITVHDLIFDRYPAYMPQAWSRPYYRLWMALSTRRARRIVAVSQATADDLTHFYRTPPAKIVVVPEGVDPGFGPFADDHRLSAVRERYALQGPLVLTVGARRPHKNLARLVRAFATLPPDTPHTLLFAGPTDARFPDEAQQAAQAANLDGRVRFLDWIPEGDLGPLYSLADVVVVPSVIEGFGLTALEAMASGTAVLASNRSSLPEVVGQAAMLVDPYDEQALAGALRTLLSDPALRRRLAEAGRARAASFTWQRAAGHTLNVFEQVLR